MKKIVFTAHAGQMMKKRKITREIARSVALYGHVVRKDKYSPTVVKRGNVGNRPVHVVMAGKTVITAYWADRWNCSVRLVKVR